MGYPAHALPELPVHAPPSAATIED